VKEEVWFVGSVLLTGGGYEVKAAMRWQELENQLHSQKRGNQAELRELAQKLGSSEALRDSVSSELSAYELRCSSLESQVCHALYFITDYSNVCQCSESALLCSL